MMLDIAVLLAVGLPFAAAPLLWMAGPSPNLRESISLACAITVFILALTILNGVLDGAAPSHQFAEPFPGLPMLLEVEILGALFGVVASGLWILTTIYAIGYMRGNNEQDQTRFYMFFAVSIGSTLGLAYSGNMLTLFIFYEALTLGTYPLVTHKRDEKAKQGGRVYLGILVGTSIGFLMLGMIWTWQLTGSLDFTPGGIMAGKVDTSLAPLLLALFAFGIGKAALMPFHRWLPAAMVAPTPVSALLHAVAVVKAGVFTVLKVSVYLFGVDFLANTGAATWLQWLAAFSILSASVIALSKDNLKARLAWSTISQLSYVTLGAAMATSAGVMGGAFQIVAHAVGKITLFFCAGAIYTATHKTLVSQLDGLGRRMPWTFGAFFIGALSIIGLPPLVGSWSKWHLMLANVDAGQIALLAVLGLSSLLNIAYLLPIVARGFLLPSRDDDDVKGIREAPLACVVPLVLTALACLLLFFMAEPLYQAIDAIPLR